MDVNRVVPTILQRGEKGIVNAFKEEDKDRHFIWEMLVNRDIAAFVAGDWAAVENDFIGDGFLGLNACKSARPDDWQLDFPTLAAYRDEWLRQARLSAATRYAEPLANGVHRATTLKRIDIKGGTAVAHKVFDGAIGRTDGTEDILAWRTLYFCWHDGRRWKISGFVGYLPL